MVDNTIELDVTPNRLMLLRYRIRQFVLRGSTQ
ncbi:hypothetical protein L914_13679 [Phytophthora nicotianae]|uniref:Uncharacterized protein n=1 Tax=Phytophthora nicotianae TaxID=4792 RepID=W2MVF7_PHYNI|nr:hypothetical protein L914_13679 [Phytophthora nicotianae]